MTSRSGLVGRCSPSPRAGPVCALDTSSSPGLRNASPRLATPPVPFSPRPSSPSICTSLPEGRLPAVWDRVKDILEEVAHTWAPDLILAPSCHDAHQDHRTIGEVCRPSFETSSPCRTKSRSGTVISGALDVLSRSTSDVAHRKVELLHKCFPSQVSRDWWDDEVFLGLARLRGMECRARYSEAFTLHEISHTAAGTVTGRKCRE